MDFDCKQFTWLSVIMCSRELKSQTANISAPRHLPVISCVKRKGIRTEEEKKSAGGMGRTLKTAILLHQH